jgi:outer membrane protein insertion porin family
MKHVFSILLLFLPLIAQAQSETTISKITISGNQRIETAAILNMIQSKSGYPLSKIQIQSDIRRLYSSGYFQNIQVFLEGGELSFDVQEKKTIVEVKFKGNESEKVKDLEKQISVKKFTYLDKGKVQEDVDKIKQFYDGKGFYLAEVEPEFVEKDKNQIEVIYKITEYQKVMVRRIDFMGNQKFSSKELKKVMRTREKGFLAFLTQSGKFQEDILAYDRQMVTEVYGQKGHINVKVNGPKIELSPDRRSLALTFFIEEGDSYTVGSVEVGGELLSMTQDDLNKKIKVQRNEVANTSKIREDIFALSSIYGDEGYAYANVLPNFEFFHDQKKVNITYLVQPGKQVTIREIRVSGNDSNRDKVILREMQITEGDLYNATKIRESKQNLERLALFQTVTVSTPKDTTGDYVDIVVQVEEKETGSFNIGAGFNTLESFQIIGRLEKRSIFGYGADVSLNAQIGKLTQIFNMSYNDEYFLDSKWGMAVNLFNISRRYTDFSLTSTGGTLGFDYPLYTKGLERIRAGLSYGLINQDLSDLRPTVEKLFTGGLTSSVTFSLSRDTRNKVVDATQGTFLKVSEEIAGATVLGGDNSFTKSEVDARLFLPVLSTKRIPVISDSVVAFRINSGYVGPLEDGGSVPLFERYYPGGVYSIRGFQLRSLGPKIGVSTSNDVGSFTTSDFVYGGNKQFIFNAEYIFPIIKPANINGVFFFDMGNAFDNGETMFTLYGQRQSAGFELRWFSPLGPLRFAWGFPLDRTEDEKLVNFDFTFGSLF